MALSDEVEELAARVRAGEVAAVARALTLVENRTSAGRELLRNVYAGTGKAIAVGITGAPGAGKSTLVDQAIAHLRARGRTVAVLAVDPSSAFTQGAILGDRIRMLRHHADEGVFIRSMSSRGQLGGVAAATSDAALLLDAAGWDVVLVETVGVGQDEIAIAHMVQATVVVLTPQTGDDVQWLKAGIMEIADVFAVNKADLGGADRMMEAIRAAQGVAMRARGSDSPPVCRVSAATGDGIADWWTQTETAARRRGRGSAEEVAQWRVRLRELVRSETERRLPEVDLAEHAQAVAQRLEDPYTAVAAIVARLGGLNRTGSP